MRFEHALKETAPIIEALLEGTQVALIRKGGLGDSAFALETDRFLLLPTRKSKKKGRYERHNDLLTDQRFEVEEISAAAEATHSLETRLSPDDYPESLLESTIFTREGLEKKLSYRPEDPTVVLLVRAYRVRPPVEMEMRPEYGGCTSWVHLADALEADCRPVLEDGEYAARMEELLRVLS